MPFFARPNLDDTQFKQLTGSTLTLSGTTHIVTPSGLTLSDGGGGNVVITAKGADFTKNGYVLTYDYPTNQIGLCLSAGSGGTTVYDYTGLTTCAVGGVSVGSCLHNCQLQEIIHTMVSPPLKPTLTGPSICCYSISPSAPTGFYEIGTCICISVTAFFSQGCVCPQYCSISDKRSGPPNTYCYCTLPCAWCCSVSTSALSNSISFTSHKINSCSENYYGMVCYDMGSPIKDSCNNIICAALSASTTCVSNAAVSATYPYFWGKSVTAPVLSAGGAQALIDSACSALKVCISTSTNDTLVTNYCAIGEYIWLAIPATSCSKTKWQGSNSPSNCGSIPGTLFPAEQCVSVNSPSSCWTSVPYKFYISNYATSTLVGVIPYSMTFKNS